ncbi:MAG: hypothetical protein QXG63_03435 [Nitrososphaerales archaeon]
MAYLVFNKRPNKRNLRNRSVSFNTQELEKILPEDQVKIVVHSETSPLVEINITGEELLKSLISVNSKDYKVFRF